MSLSRSGGHRQRKEDHEYVPYADGEHHPNRDIEVLSEHRQPRRDAVPKEYGEENRPREATRDTESQRGNRLAGVLSVLRGLGKEQAV